MGECSKDTAFEMLDFFYENGGNFIDTLAIPLPFAATSIPP